VALCGLDDELSDYLEAHLRLRWPDIVIFRIDEGSRRTIEEADLWICDGVLPRDLAGPVLMLGEIDRSQSSLWLGPHLWTCSTPITGRKLLRSIQQILAPPGP
jgi:hypothetical protein